MNTVSILTKGTATATWGSTLPPFAPVARAGGQSGA
jgi:hypothetical protein